MSEVFDYIVGSKEEFIDFEEIESSPLGNVPDPDILEVPKAPEKQMPEKEQNPYDGFFG